MKMVYEGRGHCENGAACISTQSNTVRVKDRTSAENPRSSLCQHIVFSWRAAMYFLLHVSFITLNFPRTTTSMAFVCIDSKRQEVLALANTSGLTDDWDLWEDRETKMGKGMSPDFNRSQAFWMVHRNVLQDINWASHTKGLVLSGNLFLSSVGPVLSDALQQRFAGRHVLTVALLVNAVLMVTAPQLARASPYFLLTTHILLGLTLGANAPVAGSVLPRWTPEKHRLTVTAVVYAGYNVGSIISSLMNGFLCSIPIDNGWPFIYYNTGVLIFVYAVAWFFLMADSPENHPYISEREKSYILSTRSRFLGDGKKGSRPPYLAILKSSPVLAYIFVYSGFIWTLTVLFVYLPIYLNSVLGLSAQQTGIVFAVLSCVRCIGSFFWTFVGNILTNRKILSPQITRKSCICIGLATGGCACLATSLFDQDRRWLAVALLMCTMFFQAVSTSHLSTLPMELAPRYAGTIISFTLSASMLLSLSGPMSVSYLTPSGSFEEWRYVWYLISAVFLSSSLIFLVFGQARLQLWAATEPSDGHESKELDFERSETQSPQKVLETINTNSLTASASLPRSQKLRSLQQESTLERTTVIGSASVVSLPNGCYKKMACAEDCSTLAEVIRHVDATSHNHLNAATSKEKPQVECEMHTERQHDCSSQIRSRMKEGVVITKALTRSIEPLDKRGLSCEDLSSVVHVHGGKHCGNVLIVANDFQKMLYKPLEIEITRF